MDTILNLIPGRKQHASDEPNEEAIKRTHDYLRCSLLIGTSPSISLVHFSSLSNTVPKADFRGVFTIVLV